MPLFLKIDMGSGQSPQTIVVPDATATTPGVVLLGGGGGGALASALAPFPLSGGQTPASVNVVFATPLTADYVISLDAGFPLGAGSPGASPPQVWWENKTLTGFTIVAQAQIGVAFEVSWSVNLKTQ